MTDSATRDCAVRIEATLDEVFATAGRIRDGVRTLWRDAVGTVSAHDLEPLQQAIFAELDSHPHYTGAGFLAEPTTLADVDRYLEWWQSDGSGGHSRLVLDLEPTSPDGYDYVEMEWYVGAKAGRPSVRGPYLDYAGADRFILTFATPVVVDDVFVGASGVDVLMAAFDPMLFEHVRRGAAELALVDRDDRVIVSNSPDVAPSERLRIRTAEPLPVGGVGVGWRLFALR
ncbi:cache domain-containing protein [Solicola gregarius]|uniref:Cache domain-containing protein n=1 Tax=Solicola gregarius TaxID=2908642 RepID=A0AA46TGG9_9ACTN|nr:cache domain-containing protein [Solicola gregarius]UYM04914.1 cache domain-containing protein [Solicola gregarius]